MEIGPIASFAVTGDRRLLVVDEVHHRVLMHGPDGTTRVIGGKGTDSGEFLYPRGILVLDAAVYVADSWNHRIQVFDLNSLEFRVAFGSQGSAAGELFCPSGLTFFDPWIVVADTNNSRLSFHARDGAFLFHASLPEERFPRKVRCVGARLCVQYEGAAGWETLDFV